MKPILNPGGDFKGIVLEQHARMLLRALHQWPAAAKKCKMELEGSSGRNYTYTGPLVGLTIVDTLRFRSGKLRTARRGLPSLSPWYANRRSMNLDEYKHYIRSLAIRKDGQPVLNASMDHASVIVERLFATAEDKIDILSGFFNARVYGREPVISEARLFLASSPEHKMRIILESGSARDRAVNPFFAECAQFPNLELRKAPPDLQSRYAFHFIVADAASYRFEADKNSPSAVATFGDTAGAKNLEGLFQTLWETSDAEAILPERPN